jgi:formylglycine-generating enzyme required for sulfatase activity
LEENEGMSLDASGSDEGPKTEGSSQAPDSQPEDIIQPVSFRRGQARSKGRLASHWKKAAGVALATLFICLAYAAWFVFTAKQVVIEVAPEPDRISIKGALLAPRFGQYYLLRPGSYVLSAQKQGYHQVGVSFTVSREKGQKLTLVMEKLPGRLAVSAHQRDDPSLTVEGARVYLDGEEIGTTPMRGTEVKPGLRHLTIRAENYQDLHAELNVLGMGIAQSFDFVLVPGWSEIKVSSVPTGAAVYIDDRNMGKTPLSFELYAGTYELKITAEGYKPWGSQLEVKPDESQALTGIALHRADGTLALQTVPPGAQVTVGGTYVGRTPVDILLEPDTDHIVRVSKAGYENTESKVTVGSAKAKRLTLELKPRTGAVYLTVEPADAQLLIDGESRGVAPKTLSLLAVEHSLEIVKEGYEPYAAKITPRPGFPQELKVTLKKKASPPEATQAIITAENGYTLRLIYPAPFTMGSSRREQGRRSNETLRNVALKQPFYMGVREVTNGEFREFLAQHNSGSYKSQTLNRDDQPAVHVTWHQAALFCNWLSEKENLPTAYVEREGKLIPKEPLTIGYRLPTEAEWEYCGRFAEDGSALRYPWGNTFPPRGKTVNVADLSSKDLLPAYLDRYDDGHPVAAPAASFKANSLGLYDLGGNAAEWCHDYYSIYPFSASALYVDPTGPQEGKHHVIRGSSWKQASISVLRSAYRDYSGEKRADLGFRICRYAAPSDDKE